MYHLADQVRDVALGYADVHVQQRTRPRALCEFDGEKWTPIEVVGETQLDGLQPQLRQLSVAQGEEDSAYSSTAASFTGHTTSSRGSISARSLLSSHSRGHEDEQADAGQAILSGFRRSSAFRLPELEIEDYAPEDDDIPEALQESDEADDILRELIVQQQSAEPTNDARRPSIFSSPTYQRNLINFADLAVSEVDLSEDDVECDLNLARRHIFSAFPKQFEAQKLSKEPLTTFSVYSRAEDYVEMLHVVLVLESRTVFWKFLGPSNKPVDQYTTLPYCWAADLDLPPLSLDEPKVTNEVECIIMGRSSYSTILCDDHLNECRKCKGLASEDDCFACEGTGIFKKRPCVMCSGNGQYFCTTCKNSGKVTCKTCGSREQPVPILRQAFIACTRETVVSPTIEVEGDNKATLITTAKHLAKQTIEEEKFEEGTLPVAACGVLIRQRGHIICATDIRTGARGLFEVTAELDRVEFKGQLAPITNNTNNSNNGRPSSLRSKASQVSTQSKRASWFGKKNEEADADDSASIKSTASSRLKNMFRRK